MVANFFLKNRKRINTVLIFTVSFLMIFLTYQKDRKFRYEFQKSAPWQHENLFAPFKFSVNKLPERIEREKDSIIENPKLFFIYDKTIEKTQIQKLRSDFKRNWRNFKKEDSIARANNLQRVDYPTPQKSEYDKYLETIIFYLEYVYERGIYDPSVVLDYTNNEDYKIVTKKDDIVKTYMRNQIFTLKTSYEYVKEKINKDFVDNQNQVMKNFFKNKLFLKSYITENLFFDKKQTEKIKEISLNNVSSTIGVVKAGELIIAKGEIVTKDKYRILLSLKNNYERSGKYSKLLLQIGNGLIVFSILLIFMLFLSNNKPKIYNDIPSLLMVYILIVVFVVLFSLVSRFSLFSIYILPLPLLPLILKIFFEERVALFSFIITILLIGFNVPNGFDFVIIEFVGGFAAIYGLTHLSRRGQLYISAASSFVAMSLIHFSIKIIQEGMISKIDGMDFLYFGICGLLLMLAYPLIYALEKIFGFISDITLLELSNTNHKLLQKLASKAPGTFQHSIQVASLCEAAANKIDGNSLLVRVGALYHDIGKTNAPSFFIENQVTGFNPHDQVEFDQSAQIIINHVNQGIAMATKSHLPQQIIDFIRTHHGTNTVQYFYKNYIKKYPEKKDEIEKFSYPGPKPFSKETAILMMADSIEAASRSLNEINHKTISDLVDKIINYQMENKQYEEADITFKEISQLRDLFKNRLINIYHARIEYPK